MSAYVVDASVAAKWYSEEEHSDAARMILYRGDDLYAPDFLMLEMDNVLCKWIRRGIIKEAEADRIRKNLSEIPIKTYPFERLQNSAYSIAKRSNRSIYDCLYISLAVLLETKMVTADKRLYKALAKSPFADSVAWVRDIK